MDLLGRRVKMVRAYRDPNIPPKPRNAFSKEPGPHQFNGDLERTKDGVYVRVPIKDGYREFEILQANIECIEYFPEEAHVIEIAPEKRGPGRPPKGAA